MQAAQKWTRPRNKRPDDDPHDEKPVYEESEGCENGEEATTTALARMSTKLYGASSPSTSHGTRRTVIKRICD